MNHRGWSIVEFCGVLLAVFVVMTGLYSTFARFGAARALEDALQSALVEAARDNEKRQGGEALGFEAPNRAAFMAALGAKLERKLSAASAFWSGDFGAAAAIVDFDVRPESGACSLSAAAPGRYFWGGRGGALDLGLSALIAASAVKFGGAATPCPIAEPSLDFLIEEAGTARRIYLPRASVVAAAAELDQSSTFIGSFLRAAGGDPVLHLEKISSLRGRL